MSTHMKLTSLQTPVYGVMKLAHSLRIGDVAHISYIEGERSTLHVTDLSNETVGNFLTVADLKELLKNLTELVAIVER